MANRGLWQTLKIDCSTRDYLGSLSEWPREFDSVLRFLGDINDSEVHPWLEAYRQDIQDARNGCQRAMHPSWDAFRLIIRDQQWDVKTQEMPDISRCNRFENSKRERRRSKCFNLVPNL